MIHKQGIMDNSTLCHKLFTLETRSSAVTRNQAMSWNLVNCCTDLQRNFAYSTSYHLQKLSRTSFQCFQGPIYLHNVSHSNDYWQTKYGNPDAVKI